jgi:DNA repair exonuclease SbcCD ATPase subunit
MTVVVRSEDLAVEEELENARPKQNIWRCNDNVYYEFTEPAPSAIQDATMQDLDVPEEAWTCEMPSTPNADNPRCPVEETDVVQLFLEKDQGPNQQRYYAIRSRAKTEALETGRPELFEQMLTAFENKVRAQEQQLLHSRQLSLRVRDPQGNVSITDMTTHMIPVSQPMEQENDKLSQDLTQARQSTDDLARQLHNQKVNQAKVQVGLQAAIEQALEELQDTNEAYTRARTRITELETQLQTSGQLPHDSTSELELVREENAELQRVKTELEEEVERQRSLRKESEKDFDALKRRLDEAQRDENQRREHHREEMGRVESANRNLISRNQELEREVRELRAQPARVVVPEVSEEERRNRERLPLARDPWHDSLASHMRAMQMEIRELQAERECRRRREERDPSRDRGRSRSRTRRGADNRD